MKQRYHETMLRLAVWVTPLWLWTGQVQAGTAANPVALAPGTNPFDAPLERIVNMLTGNVAIAIALVGLVMAGTVLIFQGGEMKDFVKSILGVVIVAAILILAGNILNFFFGAVIIV